MKRCLLVLALLAGVGAEPAAVKLTPPLGLPELHFPRQYRVTQDKVALGKKLFYDTQYSFSGKTACASCHKPEHGFTDFRPFGFTSVGTQLARNTPTVLNAAYGDYEFWDGREASLEGQTQEVFHANTDANVNLKDVIVKVAADPQYRALFQTAFEAEPTEENFAQAITCYELTLLSGNTRFDRFQFAGNATALTPAEKRGLDVFVGKGNCNACHTIDRDSALLMDQKFHNLGVGYTAEGRMLDPGRYGITANRQDFGSFKTPSLRTVSLTAPYMHDGSLPTLEEVVEFYDRGGNPNPNLDPLMKPLHLNPQEKADLVAFLKTLTEEKWEKYALPVPELLDRSKRGVPPVPPPD